jgi:hypothetical protein
VWLNSPVSRSIAAYGGGDISECAETGIRSCLIRDVSGFLLIARECRWAINLQGAEKVRAVGELRKRWGRESIDFAAVDLDAHRRANRRHCDLLSAFQTSLISCLSFKINNARWDRL